MKDRKINTLPKTDEWDGLKVGPKKDILVVGDPLTPFDMQKQQESKLPFFAPQAGQRGIQGDAPSALRESDRTSEEKNVFAKFKN